MAGFNMDEYVDVATRIAIFREKYPEGSLQSEVVQYGPDVVIVKAFAYRTPDDVRPGIGHASEVLPGTTPYTRTSELMVCETSAWGRAIVAALAADTKKGVASRDEVARAEAVKAAPATPAKKKSVGASGDTPTAKAVSGEGPQGAPSPDGQIDPNFATPAQWAKLVAQFGGKAAVLRAARARFENVPTSAEEITLLMAQTLLEESQAVSA